MNELGYRPNENARAMKFARTNVIGLLIRDITNPYFSELAQKVQDRAHEAGYGLMIGNAGSDGVEATAEFKNMLTREVDGIAVYGIRRPETLSAISKSGIRLVSLDWHLEESDVPFVGIDDFGAAREAIEHLLGHGYADIGLIAGDRPDPRVVAWTEMMATRLAPDRADELKVAGEFSLQGGYDAAYRLLTLPVPPRAILASSDVQAFGAIRAAQYLGKRIPDDVAIISIDGTDASAFTFPSLTTIQLPFQEIAEFIVDELTGSDPPSTHRMFAHTLVTRESCGCIPLRLAPDQVRL
ncbi:LacI family transcriptional regulator [Leifsonia sp. EB41]